MFRPSVNCRSGPAIAFYIPMVREYLSLSPNVEGDVKEAIKRAGGSNNESGVFLKPTLTVSVASTKTGKNQRSVSYIPQSSIPTYLLEAIDKGKVND